MALHKIGLVSHCLDFVKFTRVFAVFFLFFMSTKTDSASCRYVWGSKKVKSHVMEVQRFLVQHQWWLISTHMNHLMSGEGRTVDVSPEVWTSHQSNPCLPCNRGVGRGAMGWLNMSKNVIVVPLQWHCPYKALSIRTNLADVSQYWTNVSF